MRWLNLEYVINSERVLIYGRGQSPLWSIFECLQILPYHESTLDRSMYQTPCSTHTQSRAFFWQS